MSRRPASRNRKKRYQSKKSSGLLPIVLIVGCMALLAGAFIFAAIMLSGRGYDKVTLCGGDEADNVTVVLLDLTDPLTPTQARRLKVILNTEINRSAVNTMMSFGIVSANPQDWGSKFARCKPQTGKSANSLYENPRQIAERYDAEFQQPLKDTLSKMIDVGEDDSSPIMEALQALIAQTPYFTSTPGQRKVIIVSDMLQHSDALSAYRDQGWDYFEKTGGSARLAGNLSGVDVDIFKIPRQTKADLTLNDDFWVRYFDKQGSKLPSLSILGDL